MGRPRSRIDRVRAAERDAELLSLARGPRQRTANSVLYGEQQDGNPMPQPHTYQRVTIGSDPHAAVHQSQRLPSVLEQIANMVGKST